MGDAEENRRRGKVVTYRAKGSVCAACSLKPRCTTNKNGRSLRRRPGDEYVELVRAYMQTESYLRAIRKRKVWIEPLFAEGKLWHGMRRFRTRRLAKTNSEALVIAAGQNAKRLLAFGGRRPKGPRARPRPTARPRPQQTTGPSPKTMPRFSVFQQAGSSVTHSVGAGQTPAEPQ